MMNWGFSSQKYIYFELLFLLFTLIVLDHFARLWQIAYHLKKKRLLDLKNTNDKQEEAVKNI